MATFLGSASPGSGITAQTACRKAVNSNSQVSSSFVPIHFARRAHGWSQLPCFQKIADFAASFRRYALSKTELLQDWLVPSNRACVCHWGGGIVRPKEDQTWAPRST